LQKKKPPYKLFIAAFAVMIALSLYHSFRKTQITGLHVKDNKGVSFLETAGDSLVCIFQDGRACVWDWAEPHARQGDFQAASARAVLVDAERLASVPASGPKVLTVRSLPAGEPLKQFSVGYADQDVWPRVSFDKSAAALIRRNPQDAGSVLYEFMTVEFNNEMTGLPASLSLNAKSESLVDFAVDPGNIVYAVGSRDKTGRIVALNLTTGAVEWDRVFENTKEFCSVTDTPDGRSLLAGSRDGALYKIDAATGEILEKIELLEPGETRVTTNDFSVLNLAFSPDGVHYAATIHPVAYLLTADTDTVIHKLSPADKLVSKVAFSPDGRFFATSDLRAGYPVKLRPMPEKATMN